MCLQQFGSLYLCHDLGTGFTERSFSGQWSKKGVRVTGVLRLTTEAETFVSVSQVGRRQLRDEKQTRATHLPIKIKIFRDNDLVFEEKYKVDKFYLLNMYIYYLLMSSPIILDSFHHVLCCLSLEYI